MRTSSTRRLGVISIAALFALAFSFATPAMATGKGHTSSGTTVTEDNDTNDGGTPNNVPDAGDNRHPSGKDRSVEHGGSANQGNSTSDPDGASNGGPDKPGGSGGVDKADQDGNNGCGNDDDFEDDNNGNCGGLHKANSRTEECVEASDNDDHGKSDEKSHKADTKDCDEAAEVAGTETECDKAGELGNDEHGTADDHDKNCDHGDVKGIKGTKTGSQLTSSGLSTGAVLGTELGSAAPITAAVAPASTDRSEVLGLELERVPQAAPAAGGTAPAGASVLGATFTRGAALARTGFGLTMMALALALALLGVGFLLKRAGRSTSDF